MGLLNQPRKNCEGAEKFHRSAEVRRKAVFSFCYFCSEFLLIFAVLCENISQLSNAPSERTAFLECNPGFRKASTPGLSPLPPSPCSPITPPPFPFPFF